MNIASTVPFPGINPNCILFKLTSVCVRLSSTLQTIFTACSSSFTSLYDPQLITSPFSLKIGTITLVFHSSGISLPSNIRWHSSIVTLTPISPLATIIFTLTSDVPVTFPYFILCIASTISLRVTFSTVHSTTLISPMWSHSFSSFMIFFMCSFQIFALSSSIKPNRPSLLFKHLPLFTSFSSFFILLRK